MNATQLLAHFDRLAEAPDAVPRLRRFILDLAVRGKLVEQEAGDEPGLKLLHRIQIEKARPLKKGVIRKTVDAAEVSEDSQLFVIPRSWIWTNLAGIADFSAGRTPSRHETVFWNSGDYPWVSIRDMRAGETLFNTSETVSETARLKVFGSEPVPAGTLIMSFKLTIGRISRLGIPAFHNEAIISIRPHLQLLDPYLFKVLPLFAQSGNSKDAIKGATLNRESLSNIPIALPPLTEQHRIVAKVDELMALCDQLEAAQQERERRRDRLAAASLQRLNQPAADTAPEAQREHARFHLHHLPRLTTRPEHIKAMRQNIRSLAICGRLLPQDSRDESAAKFLKEVAAARDKLAKTGEIREAKSLNSIDLEVIPFPLPKGWEWARFGALINHSDAGISPKTEGFARSGDQWGVLKVSAVSWDRFRPEENKQLFQGLVPPDFAHVQAGDFLISRANTRELVAKCVIVNEKPVRLILSDKTVRLRLTSLGNPRFWCLVNNHADYARAYYAEEASGTSDSMKNVSRPIIYNLLMPIPPLAEQHRIVAKVDELMALCDQLEAQLTTTQTDSRRLLEAVLESALAPA